MSRVPDARLDEHRTDRTRGLIGYPAMRPECLGKGKQLRQISLMTLSCRSQGPCRVSAVGGHAHEYRGSRAHPSSNWRDPSNYVYTKNLTRDDWAWEFLRRNPAYAKIAAAPSCRRSAVAAATASDRRDRRRWRQQYSIGVGAALSAKQQTARLMPPPSSGEERRSAVLPFEARNVPADHGDAFDIRQLGHPVSLLRLGAGLEHVLLGDGIHHIQLEVSRRSLLDGPVKLHYSISGFEDSSPKLLRTLQRLVALRRLGRFPRFFVSAERRAPRWIIALRALDASRMGANRREIAAALFGQDIVRRDWDGGSDYLRSRVRRAIAAGKGLADGGYLDLLRRSPRHPATSFIETSA